MNNQKTACFGSGTNLIIFTLLVIILISFFSYSPVLKNDFVLWDDDAHLFDNTSIRSLDPKNIISIFKSTVNGTYIPLTTLSFAVEYHFFKYNEFFYHLDNLILHLCVVILIFLTGLRLGLSIFASGIASVLFGIHPMHVESVAWVTERKDVLYSVFYMAAILSYLKYLDKRKYKFFIITAVLSILSVLAKPMALSLPIILLLLDWFKGRTISVKTILEKVPICILIIPVICITYFSNARIPGENIFEGILIWPWTFTFYLRQFLFPVFSVPIYRLTQPIVFSNFEYWASIVVFFLVVFSVVRLNHYRWFILAVLFYFCSIFFLLRFDGLADTNIVADRFMYLPSLGFCFLFGLGSEKLLKGRKFMGVGLLFLLGFLGFKSFGQCQVWRDSVSLWQHQLKYFPNERIALNNLAVALAVPKQGKNFVNNKTDINYIISLYERAIRLDPNFSNSYYNFGKFYEDIGRKEEAAAYYQKAMILNPQCKKCKVGSFEKNIKY